MFVWMTLHEFFNYFKKELSEIYSSSESENIADWVFEHFTGLQKGGRHLKKNEIVSESIRMELENALVKLKKHEPVQYVLGESWFYKEKFLVTRDVLIPRPETEELVSWMISVVDKTDALSIVDIGTGSGCISIMIKKYLPNTNVAAIDVSKKALEVARINACNLKTDIDLLNLDFLIEDNWTALGTFDIITSNPPYIPLNEFTTLNKNVSEHEPSLALFVDSSDPLLFYKKIIDFSKMHLAEGGKIFVEIHEDYAIQTSELFKDAAFKNIEIRNDMYGKPRMIQAIK